MAVIVRRIHRIVRRQAGGVFHSRIDKTTGQPAKHKALIVQVRHLRPIQALVMLHLGQRGVHRIRQIQHPKAAIAEPRARRVDVGKRRRRIRTARNAERNFTPWNQLQLTHFILQPRIGQRLNLEQQLKLIRIRHVLKQGNRRKLRIDQPICLQRLAGEHRQLGHLHHCAPRSTSMRRKVSYREIMSPWAMISSGLRPLKNSLSLAIDGKP
ncbi:hypothetical protein D3C87_1444850 [compost metagenome]